MHVVMVEDGMDVELDACKGVAEALSGSSVGVTRLYPCSRFYILGFHFHHLHNERCEKTYTLEL